MKKIAIATILATAAIAASATEYGITATRSFVSGADRSGFGVTATEKVGSYGVTAGLERLVDNPRQQTRVSLVASREVAKLGKASFDVRAGGAYLNNETGADGFAAVVGGGVTYPVTQKVSVTAGLVHQFGQHRVTDSNGNQFSTGVKVAF